MAGVGAVTAIRNSDTAGGASVVVDTDVFEVEVGVGKAGDRTSVAGKGDDTAGIDIVSYSNTNFGEMGIDNGVSLACRGSRVYPDPVAICRATRGPTGSGHFTPDKTSNRCADRCEDVDAFNKPVGIRAVGSLDD